MNNYLNLFKKIFTLASLMAMMLVIFALPQRAEAQKYLYLGPAFGASQGQIPQGQLTEDAFAEPLSAVTQNRCPVSYSGYCGGAWSVYYPNEIGQFGMAITSVAFYGKSFNLNSNWFHFTDRNITAFLYETNEETIASQSKPPLIAGAGLPDMPPPPYLNVGWWDTNAWISMGCHYMGTKIGISRYDYEGKWITFENNDDPYIYKGGKLVLVLLDHTGANSGGYTYLNTSIYTDPANRTSGYFQGNSNASSNAWGTVSASHGPGNQKYNLRLGVVIHPDIDAEPRNVVFKADLNVGDIIVPSAYFRRKSTDPLIDIEYTIREPRGGNTIAFQSRNPNNSSDSWVRDINLFDNDITNNTIRYPFYAAAGSCVIQGLSGTPCSLSFRGATVMGGRYTVEAKINYNIDNSITEAKIATSTFDVAWSNDIEASEIITPRNYRPGKDGTTTSYPLSSSPIVFSTKQTNVGNNPFRDFAIQYKIVRGRETTIAGQKVTQWFNDAPFLVENTFYDQTETIRSAANIFRTQEYTHEISRFVPLTARNSLGNALTPGLYRIEVTTYLLTEGLEIAGALLNNYIVDTFRIVHSYEGTVDEIGFSNADYNSIITTPNPNKPDSTITIKDYILYKDQPYNIFALASNDAPFASSGVKLTAEIIKIGSSTSSFNHNEAIPVLPAYKDEQTELKDTIRYDYNRPFIPSEAGRYNLIITIDTDDDNNPTNNSTSLVFEVLDGMSGRYNIGRYGINIHYSTIDSAISDVYKRGVKDTVTFVLVDQTYTLGNINSEYALNMSSSIAGFNSNKLIRFVPSQDKQYIANSISINLLSRTGIGLYFASADPSLKSPFPFAPINKVFNSLSTLPGDRIKDYYGFNARVEFDGGPNKSIRIGFASNLNPNASNRIPIMFGTGANNVTIKNCNIVGAALPNPQVPLVFYEPIANTLSFSPISGVSAAILIRNMMPIDNMTGTNSMNCDTLLNNNIVIDNNIILNGSFGIMSLGMGPLYYNKTGYYTSFYNRNNSFTNNKMTGFDVAGIFLGYEESVNILNNEIYLVGINSTLQADAAGIMMGGFGTANSKGYNNYKINIQGNEISKIYSQRDAYGIKIEQEYNGFDFTQTPGNRYFPNHNDSIDIFNNVIWNIYTQQLNLSGSRYGIRLFGTRLQRAAKFDEFTVRKDTNYTISHIRIINNSIVMEDDNKINNGLSYIGGLVLQDIDTITMYNNAITVLDATNMSDVIAPIVIQSRRPNAYGTLFDVNNNIYYAPSNTENDVTYYPLIRFIEQSQRQKAQISAAGSKNQFSGLEQWGYLTNTESVSEMANFYPNLTITKTNPERLRVATPAPIGAYLSNKGKNFNFITTDIDGNSRTKGDKLYDVGAWTFAARLYENDCGILGFVTPVSMRDYRHPIYREAEYVMATRPINVVVNVRNNGATVASNKKVTLQVYQVNDLDNKEALLATYETNMDAASTVTVPVDFKLDKIKTPLFPKTYSEIGGDIYVPDRFRKMAHNVTPIYRYKVSLPLDQNTANDTNITLKEVRYYLNKSNIGTIVSVDNITLLPATINSDYITGANPNADTNFVLWIRDNIDVPTTPAAMSKIGGFLNYKALEKGLRENGFYSNTDSLSYDLIDRSVWEPNSFNYSSYRYMFWADGVNDTLVGTQETDMNRFMSNAAHNNRKNIIVSSEEIARNSAAYYLIINEYDFAKGIFGTTPKTLLAGYGIFNAQYESVPNNNDILITGKAILSDIDVAIKNTDLANLNPPKDQRMRPAWFEDIGNGIQSSLQAMYYMKPGMAVNRQEKTFGLLTLSTQTSAVYLGIDWRHYKDPTLIISAIINFLGGLNEESTSLSMELVEFDANVINNNVLLTWETASEVNTNGFVLEKLTANTFNPIYETKANRSNNISNLYSTIDSDVELGNIYTYRLKSVEIDGSYSYSNEKSVCIDAASNFISLDKPTPNPVTEDINISFTLSNEANIKLSIVDISGKEVMVLVSNETFSGSNKLSFSLLNLPSGNYNLVLNANGNIITQSFNVTK